MSRLAKLDDRNLSLMPIREPILSCDREGELLKAAQNHPKSFESNHALGVFYLEHGDGDQSIVYLKLAFAIEPRDTENARWLALAYLQSGQSSKAIDVIQSGANQQLTNPKMALLLAQIYKTSGNRLWAIAQYLSASSLDGGEENSFACGIGLVSLGATDQALKLFSQATRRNPNSAKLWMGLGIAQSLSNKKIESTYSLLKAADLDPGFLPTYLFLASLSGTSPETDTAIRKRLEALVVSNSERAEAHYDYAFALSKYLGSDPSPQLDAQVEAQLRIAIKRDPDFAPAHLKLGSLYEEEGNYPLAVGELERTVQLDPSDASAHYRLSQAYRRDNQPLKADSEMDQFKKIRPESLEDDDSTTEGLHVYAAQSAQNLTLAASCSSSQ